MFNGPWLRTTVTLYQTDEHDSSMASEEEPDGLHAKNPMV